MANMSCLKFKAFFDIRFLHLFLLFLCFLSLVGMLSPWIAQINRYKSESLTSAWHPLPDSSGAKLLAFCGGIGYCNIFQHISIMYFHVFPLGLTSALTKLMPMPVVAHPIQLVISITKWSFQFVSTFEILIDFQIKNLAGTALEAKHLTRHIGVWFGLVRQTLRDSLHVASCFWGAGTPQWSGVWRLSDRCLLTRHGSKNEETQVNGSGQQR